MTNPYTTQSVNLWTAGVRAVIRNINGYIHTHQNDFKACYTVITVFSLLVGVLLCTQIIPAIFTPLIYVYWGKTFLRRDEPLTSDDILLIYFILNAMELALLVICTVVGLVIVLIIAGVRGLHKMAIAEQNAINAVAPV